MALLCVTSAAAQGQADKPQPGKPKAEQAPKPPPPPLFPKHGRGIYKNAAGDEVIDATPQSPPLDTDDPSVPNPGEYEINLLTHLDYAKSERHFDLLSVDANYGVLPVIAGYKLPTQIKFEFPVSGARLEGQRYQTGIGEAKFGLKFNFYGDERRGISVSLYPQVEFSTGSSVDKDLAQPGQTLILPLLVSREFHDFTFVFNGGLEQALHDPDRSTLSEFGFAFGRALTRKDAAMIELRTESSVGFKDNRLVYVNAGYIHGVRNVIVYGNVGHSLFADDGLSHTYAGIGIKVQIDTKK